MFINQIRKEGPQPYVYGEFQSKKAIDFENITKAPALRFGNMLGRSMNYMKRDEDIDDILWNPYNFEHFDPKDIQKRMDLLVPENMLAIF